MGFWRLWLTPGSAVNRHFRAGMHHDSQKSLPNRTPGIRNESPPDERPVRKKFPVTAHGRQEPATCTKFYSLERPVDSVSCRSKPLRLSPTNGRSRCTAAR